MIMKVLFSPQVNEQYRVKYQFNKDGIIRIEQTDVETNESFVQFLDVSGIKATPQFCSTDNIVEVNVENGELRLVLVNYIGLDATDEESFPEVFEPKFEEFDIDEVVTPLEYTVQGSETEVDSLVTTTVMEEQIALAVAEAVAEVTETLTTMVEGMMSFE